LLLSANVIEAHHWDRCHRRFVIHIYEVRPRKDKRCVDLICDALPFGRLWHAEPGAASNAIGYARFFNRSPEAVIRVYDGAGNVIETHEHLTRWPDQEQRRQLVDLSLTDLVAPYVLRSNRVQPPSTSAMTEGVCQFLQPEQIHRHRPFPATMHPIVCLTFAICVWTSAFATLCVPGVLSSNNPLANALPKGARLPFVNCE
jgi:hypothetical protein